MRRIRHQFVRHEESHRRASRRYHRHLRSFPQLLPALVATLALTGVRATELTEPDPPAAAAERPAEDPEGLYARVAPAVVGIECNDGDYYGSGSVIDPAGLVLTATTVVPSGATGIRVFLTGGRAADARLLATDDSYEFVLLEIDRRSVPEGGFEYIPLGDSHSATLGEPAFTLGNAFKSIANDDQVALATGVVSGLFDLMEKRSQSTYVGLALETTAPVNSGMDGGPLVNLHGQLIGVLSMNYSRDRWLGTAVPVHLLKPLLREHRDWFNDHEERATVYMGIELMEIGEEEVHVLKVYRGGPAERAGLASGSVITHIGDQQVRSVAEFRSRLIMAQPGASLGLRARIGDAQQEVNVKLSGRF